MKKKNATKIKTIVVYALVVWFMMWVVADVLYLLSIRTAREWGILVVILPMYYNCGFLAMTLCFGRNYLKKKTVITIALLMLLLFISAGLYCLINPTYYHYWMDL